MNLLKWFLPSWPQAILFAVSFSLPFLYYRLEPFLNRRFKLHIIPGRKLKRVLARWQRSNRLNRSQRSR